MALKFRDLPREYQLEVLDAVDKSAIVCMHHQHGMGSGWQYKKGCRCFECTAVKRYEFRLYRLQRNDPSHSSKPQYFKQRWGETDEDFRLRKAYAETEPENYVG